MEHGAVYLAAGERSRAAARRARADLGAVLTGRLRPATWGEPEPPRAGFHAAKGVLEALLGAIRVPWALEPAREPFLHPGRSARVLVDGAPAGWIGELHPLVAAAWDIDVPAVAFELEVDAVTRRRPGRARLRGPHLLSGGAPGPRGRGADAVPAARLVDVVREAGGALLRRARGLRRLPRRPGGGGPRVARAARSSSAPRTGR